MRSLTLRHVKLSDLGVKAIAALPLVELFVQCGDKLTDAAAVSLSQCTTLRQVRRVLVNCRTHVPQNLPSLCYDWYGGLRQLRVFMPLLTDVGISAVGQLTDLHVLALLSGACTLPSKHGSMECVVEWEQGLWPAMLSRRAR